MQAKEDALVDILKILRFRHEGEGGGGGSPGPGGGGAARTYVSGTALSSALGISRTAVWKHVKNLRRMGFLIEAIPSKGYFLRTSGTQFSNFNGIGILSSLSTGAIGKKVFFYPSLDSTNIKAFELARNSEPEGTCVVADSQSNGKGRLGRRWESPPGLNIYTSIILRPDLPPQHAQNLTFLAAVATAEAIEAFSPRRPAVKWPNDVLIDSKKVAGILMELYSESDRVHFVIAGIGINVNMNEEMFPDYLRSTATSIREKAGTEVDRVEVIGKLYSSIEKWYKIYLKEGFGPVLGAWRGFFEAEGKPIRVNGFNRVITGICMGVDSDGFLLVRKPSGDVERIISGDTEPGRW